jgi:ribose 5-phosphate isomerase B
MVSVDPGMPTNAQMSLAVGGDHAGFALKGPIIEFLRGLGHTVEDCGSYDSTPVDFPDVTWAVCARVRGGRAERGILVCGSGVGACIAANKIAGIRASLIHDVYCAHQCVEHDDVNVACLGAQVVGQKLAEDCLRAFLAATFSTEEAFRRRVAKLAELERRAAAELVGHDEQE